MSTYVVVNEDYTPTLFKSLQALADQLAGLTHEDGRPVSRASLQKALKSDGFVRLCRDAGEEWTDKVFVR